MPIEKKREFIINFVYYAIAFGLAFFVFRFSVKYLMPFIFGFFIAFALKPIVNRLIKMFGENSFVRIAVILIFYIIVGLAIFGIFFGVVTVVERVSSTLPRVFNESVMPLLNNLIDYTEDLLNSLSPEMLVELESVFDSIIASLKGWIGNFSKTGLDWLTGFVGSVPSMLISILISIISSFFFTLDYQPIVNKVLSMLPKHWAELVFDVKSSFKNTIGKYLIAYGKLITLTFIELSIGFFIVGIDNAIPLAAMIAVIDILPVLGTGTVMIPWFIIEFIRGNISLGIALFIIYIIITVIRNILEPKLVGDQIGLHPLVTLVCIFVGLRLAGFAGMFGLPIAVTIIKSLHDQGKILFFKRLKAEEESMS